VCSSDLGIELNKHAHKYALENVMRNKLKNVFLYQGDAKKVAPKLKMAFDRILMPLPKDAEGFLGTALAAIRKGGIIHMYDFEKESEFDKGVEKVKIACKKAKKKCKILSITRCGQSSPHVFRVCIDFKVS
jgi:tRNA (guanine37-N1)-methyltransferase